MAAGGMYRVGVMGYGAIGSVVADQLAAGSVAGAQLEGVILRRHQPGLEHEQLNLQQALEGCDLVSNARASKLCGSMRCASWRQGSTCWPVPWERWPTRILPHQCKLPGQDG